MKRLLVKLRLPVGKVFKWIIRPKRKPSRYQLGDSNPKTSNLAMSKFFSLAGYLRRGAKTIVCSRSNPVSIQLGQTKPAEVPKGHLAVYVGESDDETKRVLVPVLYFNHPLFGELLKESERAYGFHHPGGITIPCRISELEKVKTRIASWDHCRRRNTVYIGDAMEME